jgi:hypothetical protein
MEIDHTAWRVSRRLRYMRLTIPCRGGQSRQLKPKVFGSHTFISPQVDPLKQRPIEDDGDSTVQEVKKRRVGETNGAFRTDVDPPAPSSLSFRAAPNGSLHPGARASDQYYLSPSVGNFHHPAVRYVLIHVFYIFALIRYRLVSPGSVCGDVSHRSSSIHTQ